MAINSKNPDITVRGGLLNVPDLTSPSQPPRHQPNTPRTKKQTKTRPDYQPPKAQTSTTTPESQPPAAAPPAPPPDEPETPSPD